MENNPFIPPIIINNIIVTNELLNFRKLKEVKQIRICEKHFEEYCKKCYEDFPAVKKSVK